MTLAEVESLRKHYNAILYADGLRIIRDTWDYRHPNAVSDDERLRMRTSAHFDLDGFDAVCEDMAPGDAPQHYAFGLFVARTAAVVDARERRLDFASHEARASRYGGLSALTGGEWACLLTVSCGRCVYCGKQDANDATLDHVHPLCSGGDHALWNVAVCCRSCNTRKGPRSLERWCASEGLDPDATAVRVQAAQEAAARRLGLESAGPLHAEGA